MKIENFSNYILRSNLINTYVATSFFATLIYFTINANLYTPLEMIGGVMLVTVAFKGIANLMFSLIIALFKFDEKDELEKFDKISTRVNGLLNELSLQEAQLKTISKNPN